MMSRTEMIARNLQTICVGDQPFQIFGARVDIPFKQRLKLRPVLRQRVNERNNIAAVLIDLGNKTPFSLHSTS